MWEQGRRRLLVLCFRIVEWESVCVDHAAHPLAAGKPLHTQIEVRSRWASFVWLNDDKWRCFIRSPSEQINMFIKLRLSGAARASKNHVWRPLLTIGLMYIVYSTQRAVSFSPFPCLSPTPLTHSYLFCSSKPPNPSTPLTISNLSPNIPPETPIFDDYVIEAP